jgi:hypothetical protein
MKTKKAVREKITRKPKVEPWRAELARIVKFLNKNTDGSKALWDVLSALRGPDSCSDAEKDATTAVVRHTIGLNRYLFGLIVDPDRADNIDMRAGWKFRSSHFQSHAKQAFDALDLKWTELNEARRLYGKRTRKRSHERS